MSTKIAVASDDGVSVAQNFGKARQFVVLTLDGGKVVGKEVRPKPVDQRPTAQEESRRGSPDDHFAGHRVGPGPRSRYDEMAGAIGDCEVVLTGGMGVGAYNAMTGYGIDPIITDIETVDEAVAAYLAGSIRNLTDRLQ